MKTVRIGNDITILWTVRFAQEGHEIGDYPLRLFLSHPLMRKQEVTDFRVEGSMLIWTFRGAEQKHVGIYTLTLVGNDGADGMWTIDTCEAFRLVPHSCEAGSEAGSSCDCGNVKAITLEMSSMVENVAGNVFVDGVDEELNAESGNPVANKAVTEAVNSLRAMFKDFVDGAPNVDGIINRWKEVVDFLSGTEEGATLEGLINLAKEGVVGQAVEGGGEVFNAYDVNVASGINSHAEGYNTKAEAADSHAEGWGTRVLPAGNKGHVEGKSTVVSGECGHAEGAETVASQYGHSEGVKTYSGDTSHAEGFETNAGTRFSHAEGFRTVTTNDCEHAEGTHNASHTGTRHSIGIGSSPEQRKNAVEVMDDGRVFMYGIGGYNGTNPGSAKPLHKLLSDDGKTYFELKRGEFDMDTCLEPGIYMYGVIGDEDQSELKAGNYVFMVVEGGTIEMPSGYPGGAGTYNLINQIAYSIDSPSKIYGRNNLVKPSESDKFNAISSWHSAGEQIKEIVIDSVSKINDAVFSISTTGLTIIRIDDGYGADSGAAFIVYSTNTNSSNGLLHTLHGNLTLMSNNSFNLSNNKDRSFYCYSIARKWFPLQKETDEIKDGAITRVKIADYAITENKLSPDMGRLILGSDGYLNIKIGSQNQQKLGALGSNIFIGKNTAIYGGVYIADEVKIGSNVEISQNVKIGTENGNKDILSIGSSTIIGSDVHIGSGGHFVNIGNNYSVSIGNSGPVSIGSATIGHNVSIGGNVRIDNNVYIGSSSDDILIGNGYANSTIGAYSYMGRGLTIIGTTDYGYRNVIVIGTGNFQNPTRFATFGKNVVIGENTNIGDNVSIPSDFSVDVGVQLLSGAKMYSTCYIGTGVQIDIYNEDGFLDETGTKLVISNLMGKRVILDLN